MTLLASINVHNYLKHMAVAEVSTYDFSGDAVTVLGLVGVVSTAIIVLSVFRSYWNSPYRK